MWPFRRGQIKETDTKIRDRTERSLRVRTEYSPEVLKILNDYVDKVLTEATTVARGLNVEDQLEYKLDEIPEEVLDAIDILINLTIFCEDYGLQYETFDNVRDVIVFKKIGEPHPHNTLEEIQVPTAIQQDTEMTISKYIEDAVHCISEGSLEYGIDEFVSFTLISMPKGIKTHDLVMRIVLRLRDNRITAEPTPGSYDSILVPGTGDYESSKTW